MSFRCGFWFLDAVCLLLNDLLVASFSCTSIHWPSNLLESCFFIYVARFRMARLSNVLVVICFVMNFLLAFSYYSFRCCILFQLAFLLMISFVLQIRWVSNLFGFGSLGMFHVARFYGTFDSSLPSFHFHLTGLSSDFALVLYGSFYWTFFFLTWLFHSFSFNFAHCLVFTSWAPTFRAVFRVGLTLRGFARLYSSLFRGSSLDGTMDYVCYGIFSIGTFISWLLRFSLLPDVEVLGLLVFGFRFWPLLPFDACGFGPLLPFVGLLSFWL